MRTKRHTQTAQLKSKFLYFKAMKRIVHKSRDFREAELWDIKQQVSLSPEERQKAAKELKARVFGNQTKDVRDRPKKK